MRLNVFQAGLIAFKVVPRGIQNVLIAFDVGLCAFHVVLRAIDVVLRAIDVVLRAFRVG